MRVYRLEKNDYGVFCNASMVSYPNYPDDALYANYGFSCDQRYHFNDGWRSACESIEKLIDYFGSDFAFFLGLGAEIVEYNVDKRYIRFSKLDESIEVVFKREKAKERTVILKGNREEEYTPPVQSNTMFSISVSPSLWSFRSQIAAEM